MKLTTGNTLLLSIGFAILAIAAGVSTSFFHAGYGILFFLLGTTTVLLLLLVGKIREDIHKQKKSEEKFRSLLDAAPDATVIVNNRGIIEMVNLQAERVFGYNRFEMIGKSVELLIPGNLRK